MRRVNLYILAGLGIGALAGAACGSVVAGLIGSSVSLSVVFVAPALARWIESEDNKP